MRPIVRDLYKRFLIAGRHYPQGLQFVREKAKAAFFENADILTREPVTPDRLNFVNNLISDKKLFTFDSQNSSIDVNEINFKKAISKGRFWVREIMAISKMSKYRAMKSRYESTKR